jgi:hypothetical protein
LTVGFPPEETLQGAEYIRWVQASLNRVLALRLPVNGILGPETRSAVRRFQERERLPVTGIVGPDTERALIAALAGIGPAEPAGVAPAEPAEPEPSEGELDDLEFAGDLETEYGEEEENDSLEVRELNPALVDLAEKIFAREAPFVEGEVEGEVASRWTRCFSNQDIEKVITAYKDNAKAAGANRNDRCSCIVMLNVALGQLLSLRLKEHPARGRPPTRRRVQMGDLPTGSIEEAMQQLRRKGFAVSPWVTSFFDRRKRTAGTLKPEELKASVQAKVLAAAQTKGCWFAFALSVLNGYHSVLLLVDHTAVLPSGASAPAKIFWLDQFSTGRWMDADVTNSLDQRLKEKTQAFWDAFRKTRIEECVKRGRSRADCTRLAARSDTTIRLWQLKKRR